MAEAKATGRRKSSTWTPRACRAASRTCSRRPPRRRRRPPPSGRGGGTTTPDIADLTQKAEGSVTPEPSRDKETMKQDAPAQTREKTAERGLGKRPHPLRSTLHRPMPRGNRDGAGGRGETSVGTTRLLPRGNTTMLCVHLCVNRGGTVDDLSCPPR